VSQGASPSLSNGSASGRRRRHLEADFSTSIDLTSKDAVFVPEIVKAAQNGTREDIERLIIQGNNLEDRDTTWGKNALLIAAHCGKDDIVDLLLRNNAHFAVTDGSGWTALHLAASRGHCGVLELLVVENDLVEAQTPRGETALRIAAEYGQADALLLLLRHHAQVNARADKQLTALHAAAKRGDDDIVELLVRYGADVEAKDGKMMTALHYASRSGNLEVMEILLDHKANIEAPGSDRKTPLICAAEAGRSKAVELLLKRKASSQNTDDTGMTALHWAAYNGHTETVRILGEKKKGLLDMTNKMGRTALHLAVMQSKFAVVELLQRKGTNLDRRCKTGLTALHYACMADSFEIANLLLISGADIEASESQHQQRSLHIVASKGSIHLLDLLCDKGASLDARNGVGDRALCAASRYGHTAIVQKLLDRGSPLSMKFETGVREDSPLCLAAMGGHLHVSSLLLNRGASALKKDETGWQPFRYAAYHGHPDVLDLLLSRSNISESGIPDIMNMPETIGFSPSVSEDKRHEVLQLLRQTLKPVNPHMAPPSQFSSQRSPPLPDQLLHQHLTNVPAQFFTHLPIPQAPSLHHSIRRAYTPPVYPYSIPTAFEADSSTPQELPGSLHQETTSTRSINPEHVQPNSHIALARDISNASTEPTLPITSEGVAAMLRRTRETPTPQPQWGRETRRSNRLPPPNSQRVQLSATYTPISLPPSPSPPVQSSPLPYRTRDQGSMTSSPLNSDRPVEVAQIPRSLLSQYTMLRAGPQYLDERQDDDSSDTDSISTVYTAPEGEDLGIPTNLDHREGVKELV
jgi:ankyrin repeat protein